MALSEYGKKWMREHYPRDHAETSPNGEPPPPPPSDEPPPPAAAVAAIPEPPKRWHALDLKPATQPRWLAKARIPRAAPSLIIGEEGIGKSLLWVWITANISTGRAAPGFGIPERDPSHVVIAAITEDDWCTAVRPRLEVRADVDTVGLSRRHSGHLGPTGAKSERLLRGRRADPAHPRPRPQDRENSKNFDEYGAQIGRLRKAVPDK